MRKIIKIIFVSLVCLGLKTGLSLAAEKNKPENIFPPYSLAADKEFTYEIPLDWKAYVFPGQTGFYFRRILIMPPGKKSFKLNLEIYPNNYLSPCAQFSKRNNRVAAKREIKKYLNSKFLEIKDFVGSEKINIQSFKGEACKGLYFSEKIIKSNDMVKAKYLTQGVFLLEGYIVFFDIKGNYGQSTTFAQLFNLLKSCKIGDSSLVDSKNEEEEKIATLLAFLGQEYKKINNFQAVASVQVIEDKKVLKKKQQSTLNVDSQKQFVRADNKKENLTVVGYPEESYGYYNFFAKSRGEASVLGRIDSFVNFDWFFFFWPWRDEISFSKEHNVEVKKNNNTVKGEQVLLAKTKPLVFKFYDSLELTIDVFTHRVKKAVYSLYGGKLRCWVYFDYKAKSTMPAPTRIRVRLFNEGVIVGGKNIFLKNIKTNIDMSASIFEVESKKSKRK